MCLVYNKICVKINTIARNINLKKTFVTNNRKLSISIAAFDIVDIHLNSSTHAQYYPRSRSEWSPRRGGISTSNITYLCGGWLVNWTKQSVHLHYLVRLRRCRVGGISHLSSFSRIYDSQLPPSVPRELISLPTLFFVSTSQRRHGTSVAERAMKQRILKECGIQILAINPQRFVARNLKISLYRW